MTKRTVGQTLRDMGQIEPQDRLEVSQGFDRGNYAAAYETEDYTQAAKSLIGVNGFTRVGHLLGFFSTYELHEVPEDFRSEVEHYREAAKILGFPGGA